MGDKPNPMGLNLKLNYLRVDPDDKNIDGLPSQPVLVKLKGNKTLTKLVPVKPLTPELDKCFGCIAENTHLNNERVDCFDLPQCDNTIYVRANSTTLLSHMIWRLENDK